MRLGHRLISVAGIALAVLAWDIAVRIGKPVLLPGPLPVLRALVELGERGLLLRHVVASLFRVTWGFLGAVLVGVPLGMVLGMFRPGERALNPMLQVLRPISPLAWIPISIFAFGVGDAAAIFIIFVASVMPLTLFAMSATRGVPQVHLNAGRNFGLGRAQLMARVVLPAVLPQLLAAMRLTLGIAWLVVVAAEMIAVNSGLGFLIVDSRNAGNRYDLVIGGMLLIGLIGLGLDTAMRGLGQVRALHWAATNRQGTTGEAT